MKKKRPSTAHNFRLHSIRFRYFLSFQSRFSGKYRRPHRDTNSKHDKRRRASWWQVHNNNKLFPEYLYIKSIDDFIWLDSDRFVFKKQRKTQHTFNFWRHLTSNLTWKHFRPDVQSTHPIYVENIWWFYHKDSVLNVLKISVIVTYN